MPLAVSDLDSEVERGGLVPGVRNAPQPEESQEAPAGLKIGASRREDSRPPA